MGCKHGDGYMGIGYNFFGLLANYMLLGIGFDLGHNEDLKFQYNHYSRFFYGAWKPLN